MSVDCMVVVPGTQTAIKRDVVDHLSSIFLRRSALHQEGLPGIVMMLMSANVAIIGRLKSIIVKAEDSRSGQRRRQCAAVALAVARRDQFRSCDQLQSQDNANACLQVCLSSGLFSAAAASTAGGPSGWVTVSGCYFGSGQYFDTGQ